MSQHRRPSLTQAELRHELGHLGLLLDDLENLANSLHLRGGGGDLDNSSKYSRPSNIQWKLGGHEEEEKPEELGTSAQSAIPVNGNETASSAQQAEPAQPSNRPNWGVAAHIHPISHGGRVTWTDHNDLVYRAGMDRGERLPGPPRPKSYQSKGPLKGFDFSKLRGDSVGISFFDFMETSHGTETLKISPG
jgi:hypothetical protein